MALRWRAGQVHLLARGLEGAMLDARVRFSGPEEVPAVNLGPDGEAWFELGGQQHRNELLGWAPLEPEA